MASMLKKVKNIPEMLKGDIWGWKVDAGYMTTDGVEVIKIFLVVDKVDSHYICRPLDINHDPVWMTTKDFVDAYNKGLLVKKG